MNDCSRDIARVKLDLWFIQKAVELLATATSSFLRMWVSVSFAHENRPFVSAARSIFKNGLFKKSRTIQMRAVHRAPFTRYLYLYRALEAPQLAILVFGLSSLIPETHICTNIKPSQAFSQFRGEKRTNERTKERKIDPSIFIKFSTLNSMLSGFCVLRFHIFVIHCIRRFECVKNTNIYR